MIDHLARVEAAVNRLSGREVTADDLLACIWDEKERTGATSLDEVQGLVNQRTAEYLDRIGRVTNLPGPMFAVRGHAKETRK